MNTQCDISTNDEHNSVTAETQQGSSANMPEISTCRYSSKPCSNPRATKKTGDLHNFCEFHRLMANRNQRRCEQKRRTKRQLERAMQKRKMQPQPTHVLMGFNINVPNQAEMKARRRRSASPSSVIVPMASIDLYGPSVPAPKPIDEASPGQALEPFTHPVQLQDEDLQYLLMTVVDSSYDVEL